MSHCPHTERIAWHNVVELTPRWTTSDRQHLKDCQSCREESSELQTLALGLEQAFQSAAEALPPQRANVIAALAPTEQRRSRRRAAWSFVTVGLVATLLILLAYSGYVLLRSLDSPALP